MKVAVIHDWLTGMRGGEFVLEAICELYPDADIFTLIHFPEKISQQINRHTVKASVLRFLPRTLQERYRFMLPILPFFAERFDLRGYDLVISSSHCVAKGVRKMPRAYHLSYVHAPMRYVWDRFDDYFGAQKAKAWVRLAARICRPFLQAWDRRVSQVGRVDCLVANSKFIAEQIFEHYSRTAHVIYPFCDYEYFQKHQRDPKDFYLVVSAFAPYKRIDLAIEAARIGGFQLKIVGSGQDEQALKNSAPSNVEFLGNLNRDEIAKLYSKCSAFLFPGVEDFGITPLEAMASGAPVIAYQKGGACETVTLETGCFFTEQTVTSLLEAIRCFERDGKERISEQSCRARAKEFSKLQFQSALADLIKAKSS